uniref:Putative secreted protein n=1 Tax=Ixodes ricinus TaxID=34613 RepID=A0A6B0UEX1_IXORI
MLFMWMRSRWLPSRMLQSFIRYSWAFTESGKLRESMATLVSSWRSFSSPAGSKSASTTLFIWLRTEHWHLRSSLNALTAWSSTVANSWYSLCMRSSMGSW